MPKIEHESNMDKIIERQRKVIKLAEEQLTYQIWSDLQEKTKRDFDDFF